MKLLRKWYNQYADDIFFYGAEAKIGALSFLSAIALLFFIFATTGTSVAVLTLATLASSTSLSALGITIYIRAKHECDWMFRHDSNGPWLAARVQMITICENLDGSEWYSTRQAVHTLLCRTIPELYKRHSESCIEARNLRKLKTPFEYSTNPAPDPYIVGRILELKEEQAAIAELIRDSYAFLARLASTSRVNKTDRAAEIAPEVNELLSRAEASLQMTQKALAEIEEALEDRTEEPDTLRQSATQRRGVQAVAAG